MIHRVALVPLEKNLWTKPTAFNAIQLKALKCHFNLFHDAACFSKDRIFRSLLSLLNLNSIDS